MKIKERKKRLENRGFTLIELIVTVAIIAIFSGVVLTFITTGSNTYRSTSNTAKVQMETQETFDQIEEMIIDVNRSLYYANGTGDSIGSEIKNDIKQEGAANSTGNKTFIMCNEFTNNDGTSQYICDVLDWDKNDATIYYSQREYKATSSSGDSETSVESLLLAEDNEETAVAVGDAEGETNVKDAKTKVERSVFATGILDFRADVSKVESDKIVRFQLSTQSGNKEIETLHSVSIRNDVKVKKPADAFNTATATDVGITIINAPASIDPGTSTDLIYKLTGNGSIDPTSVTWTVVENTQNGSFPSADPTNGKLTIADDAVGTITVKVSARTNSGKWIESAPVTIPITAKGPTANSLTLSTRSILVAADGSYNLGDIIRGTLTYSDGTTEDTTGLTWSLKTTTEVVSLNGTKLVVSADAGKEASTGTVTLTATATEDGKIITADLEVRIARIDLTEPTGIYKVGDAKPQGRFIYTYMEADASVASPDATSMTMQAIKEGDTQDKYTAGSDYFTADDIGTWTATVSYKLSGTNKYGTVKSLQTFNVVDNTATGTGEIILNKDVKYDTVVAGQKYTVNKYENCNIRFIPNLPADAHMWKSNIRWYLKEDKKSNISISSSDDGATITVPANATRGFTLCVDYTQYKGSDGNWNEIYFKIHAEREFNIITGIELRVVDSQNIQIENNGNVSMNNDYTVYMYALGYDAAGNDRDILVTPKSGKFYNKITENSWPPLEENENQTAWIYKPSSVGEKKLKADAPYDIEGETIVSNDSNWHFTTEINLNVTE